MPQTSRLSFAKVPESVELGPALSIETLGSLELIFSTSIEQPDIDDDISVAASVMSTSSIASALTAISSGTTLYKKPYAYSTSMTGQSMHTLSLERKMRRLSAREGGAIVGGTKAS